MKDYSPILQQLFFFIFWVGATFGFISDEILPFIASGRSAVFLILDALWVVLACFTVRRWVHIVPFVFFIGLSWFITCSVEGLPVPYWMNGLRDFISLFLAYPILCYFMGDDERRKRFVPALDKSLKYFLILQAPCVVYQFILYGAGDHVGGSFGNWYSGQLSICIYITSFYLVRKSLDTNNLWRSLRENSLPIILLFPTFLNETKISFVLIILYFLLLMPIDKRYLMRAMILFPAVMLLLWGAATVYVSVTGNKDDAEVSLDYIEKYFMTDDVDNIEGGAKYEIEAGSDADVPRFAKLVYLTFLYEQEPGREVTGWGVGQFKGGTEIETSEFAYEYDWLLMGSIPYVFHVIIQMGYIGMIIVVVWLLSLFIIPPAWSRGRDYNAQMLVMAIILIIMAYNDTLRNIWMCIFLFMLLASSWKYNYRHDDDEDNLNENEGAQLPA